MSSSRPRGCSSGGDAREAYSRARAPVSTGWAKPHPGDDRVPSPDEVPGRDNPPRAVGD
ncbi:hypothetical protein [Streptomyces sp. DT203]|uniref:hypothetical protein n=1 Tax=Streptomyces sp. DT203 TaxID=3393424 RepID=UPI003CF41CA0